MTEVVVDTSVVVKWYIPERNHEAARRLRDDYLDGQFDLIAPALMPFEAVNALKYSGYYEGDSLETAGQSLSEYGIDFVSFGEAGSVAALADRLDISVYDAAYVALARERESTVYTADETLLDSLGDYREFGAHIRAYS